MSLILDGSVGVYDVDGSAATPAIRGTDTNTGIYFPGADRIGFSEGGTQVGEFDANGNFLFNSGYGSAAIGYGCRAWVNFNGTGTVAIRASGNVTSITDNGSGTYTVNLTTAMPDANYSPIMEASFGTPWGDQVDFKECFAASTSTIQVGTYNGSAFTDAANIYVAIFR